MGEDVSREGILDAVRSLLGVGASLHWLVPKQKRPIEADWAAKPRYPEPVLKVKYTPGANIGIRLGQPSETPLGFIHVVDLDIRRADLAEEAWSELLEMWPDAKRFPTVISGSGGESRHIYFITSTPFAKKKLRKSKGFSMVFDKLKEREVKKFDWEIDLMGTGSQAVIPPSIHPDTDLPYRWERPFRTSTFDLGAGPTVDPSLVESWGARSSEADEDPDDDDLESIVRAMPLDLEESEIDEIMSNLPADWVDDRDAWYQVGMALHHQYEGSNQGYERWVDWSRQSEKFDAKDQARVWKSFKGTKRPVRMATLIQASAANRMRQEQDIEAETPAPRRDLSLLLGGDGDSSKVQKATQEPVDDGPDWVQLLHRNEEGELKSTLHNLALIVRNDKRVKGIVFYNEFSEEVVLRGNPQHVKKKRPSSKPVINLTQQIWTVQDPLNGDLWSDSHDTAIRAMIEAPTTQGGYGIKVSDRDLRGAVDIVAHQNPFHPVREAILSEEWDGIPRVDRLFVNYLGCADTPYHRSAARLTLVGAVSRVFEPGHKFDFVPILEGVQGKGKSTFIQTLGMDWYLELTGDMSDQKAMVESMMGSWIIEIGELSAMHRAEVNELKQALSRQVDKVRLSYDRRPRKFKRQCIYMGSTNDHEYLRDPTGNRRFWPIVCNVDGQIDIPRLRREVSQLWAEAYAMYRDLRGRQPFGDLPLYLDDEKAHEESLRIQASRQVETAEDALAGEIMAWLDQPIGFDSDFDDLDDNAPRVYRNETCIGQIWKEMLGRSGAIPQIEASKIGKAMVMTGWDRSRGPVTSFEINKKYGQVRVYTRPKD